jgi:primosomal protein N' (replication factor Y) (superfamily II helicase)
MPLFCDVALPVPLDTTFTYRLDGVEPVVGGRVVVPFREKRLSGIVTALHDTEPEVKTKTVLNVLDAVPALSGQLLELGRWIAHYYLAPLGEVYRTMLPLGAEFRRVTAYRITDAGVNALHASAEEGSSRRSKKDVEHQMVEYAVLDRLLDGEVIRESTLRSSTGASREVLRGMLRKKWIAIEDLSDVRDATRVVRYAVLRDADVSYPRLAQGQREPGAPKMNVGQQAVVDALRELGGRATLEELRARKISQSSLQTLAKKGAVAIVSEKAEFAVSGMKARKTLDFIFTAEQRRALKHVKDSVEARRFGVALMHGVTGSGKTAVYLAAMQEVLKAGRSAILMVPEIGLTPAMAADLHQVFGEQVAILHSSLSDDERAEQWRRIRRGDAKIVVGTRSAVFAPVEDLALIVVDEEHDSSYKQDETPRYHGRDVAIVRAKLAGATVVLGSATPSLESYYNAQKGKYTLLELPSRVSERPLPEVEVVDMRAEFQRTGHDEVLALGLLREIEERLHRGEQAMVLLNRRGYSAVVMCRACGESVQCQNCAIAMTHHKRQHRLICHYCGFQKPVPKTCPKCGSEYVQFLGTGSEKLEHLLHAAFPEARIARLDRDTVRDRDDMERMLAEMHAGGIDLLVGTQMIAKGHDVHGVTLVGVVAADAALGFPDFRAAERTFQLLTQVAGRAGRGDTPGKVIVQTFATDHYAVQYAAKHDFNGFYDKELRFRSWMHYPPFTALANVLVRSDKLEEALRTSGVIGKWFESTRHEGVRVLGPAAAPIVKLKNDFRYQFLLKSASREKLNGTLRAMLAFAAERKIPRGSLMVDMDAVSLM